MADEETVVATEEEDKDIWEILNLDPPEEKAEEEKYTEYEQEEDPKTSKMERKLSSKMDEMQKKFEQTIMRERISKFEESADDLSKDLFRTIAADVRDVETLDKALKLVNERADKMKADEEEYRKQREKAVEQQVAQAWGAGPIAPPSVHKPEDEEKLIEKIRAGDEHALFEALMEDNWPRRD